ncbi:short transient receptor potential channel 7-like [Diadema setosum]|uniref:short transient receptor potential channel 7-like n=1 Tax=Diadema setosum TaxID=31175 RepID=UPI003B3A57CF
MPIKKSLLRNRSVAGNVTDAEAEFLNGVSMGNLAYTRSALEVEEAKAEKLLRVTDTKDRTALEIATENEHLDIVRFFIEEHDHILEKHSINESLMLAITKGYLNITEILLQHSGFDHEKDHVAQMLGQHTSFYDRNFRSKFERDVTPIMMAARCNEVEILRLFLDRGEVIVKPHHPYCECTSCLNRKEFDPLMHSLTIINAYRALSSEAYICLTSQDPILTAFLLSKELNTLSLTEKEFKNQYRDLEEKCKEFASNLIDMCQNTSEVKTILQQEATTEEEIAKAKPNPRLDTRGDDNQLPRLELAIKYRQKQFVAHPNCQHHLSTLWYNGFPGWRQTSKLRRFLLAPLILLMLPFSVIGYLVYPYGRFGDFMRSPIVKFFTQSSMYMCFLVLMFLESVTAETFKVDKQSLNEFVETHSRCEPLMEALTVEDTKTSVIRPSSLSIIEILLLIFVIGMAWQEIKQIWSEGGKDYLRSIWNWIDLAMLNLLIGALLLITICSMYVVRAKSYFKSKEQCNLLKAGNPIALTHLYYLSGDRKNWRNDDPILVAEALFAMANVLSFSRLSFILPVSEFLGPLQISLGRMMTDISRFAAVFGVVFLAFFCAMCNLYWYYPDNSSFGTLGNSFRTLVWALFGMGDTSDTECPEDQPNCGHVLTQVFGNILYAIYQAVMVIVMLNMLIAMMSTSFDEINNDEDVEWKFARAKLWLSYFGKGATLPAPFNIVPSLKTIIYACRWLKAKLFRRSSARLMHRPGQHTALNAALRRVTSHEDLMKVVVKRFLFQLQRTKDSDEVDEGELDEIKNDISSFRFDVLEILEKLSDKVNRSASPAITSATRQRDDNDNDSDDAEASAVLKATDELRQKSDELSSQMKSFREEFSKIVEKLNERQEK